MPEFREETRKVPVDGAVLAGTLARPLSGGPWPVALLLGGTFGDLRDGDVDPRLFPNVPPRGMYAILANELAKAGIASFRFDRRGAGESTGEFAAGRAQEVDDAGKVWRWVGSLEANNGYTALLGHSAGAYVLCRVAREVGQPDAAVLQGALYRSIPALLEYNLRPVIEYMGRSSQHSEWVARHAPKAYRDAHLLDTTLRSMSRGEAIARANVDGQNVERDLSGIMYDLDRPPEDQFRYLQAPTLVLHASDDLNVPVSDAFHTFRAMRESGNNDVEVRIIPGANHSFQIDSDDPDRRLKEKVTLLNFGRPFHPQYPSVVVDFLSRQIGKPRT